MPTADLQNSQKIEIEKLVFSLHIKPSASLVTRPEVDVFHYLFILFLLRI